jgi:glutamate--cysteine ligase catalytic subunit
MGLLEFAGAPLDWDQTKTLSEYVREHGVKQFINIYNQFKDKQHAVLRWGDEVRSERAKLARKRPCLLIT